MYCTVQCIALPCTTIELSGAYGTVYRAEDLERKEIVAMKKVAITIVCNVVSLVVIDD